MTNKAQAALQKMKRLEEKRALRLFRNPQARDRVLNNFNQSTLDEVGPVGGAERKSKLLSEMNPLAHDHEAFVKSLSPRADVL
jgi:hypothetical protein